MNKVKKIVDKKILIVDNNDDVSWVTGEVCRLKTDFDTVSVSNGLEAIKYMQTHKAPALIILDLEMPEMNGFEFKDFIKQHPLWHDIPIIIFTALILDKEQVKRISDCPLLTKGAAGCNEIATAVMRATQYLTN